jgi:hypothetical protein
MDIFKVDVDKASSIAEKYEIASMPTFIMFKKAVELGRMTGVNPEGLRTMIKNNYSNYPPVKQLENMSINSQYDPYSARGQRTSNTYEYPNRTGTINQNGINMIETSQGSFNPQESAPPQSSKYYMEHPEQHYAKLVIDSNYHNSQNNDRVRPTGYSVRPEYQNINREYQPDTSKNYSQYKSSSQNTQKYHPSDVQYDQKVTSSRQTDRYIESPTYGGQYTSNNQPSNRSYFPAQYSPSNDNFEHREQKNTPSPSEPKSEVQKPKLVPIRKTQMSPKITVDTKVIPHDSV